MDYWKHFKRYGDNTTRIEMLFEWYDTGRHHLIPRDHWQNMVSWAWTGCDSPSSWGVGTWVRIFKDAGFVTDKDGIHAPTGMVTVFRGSTPKYSRGLSWTTNRDTAEWFAQRERKLGYAGMVHTVTVPPRHVLGMFFDRKESEVVVNPWGLRGIKAVQVGAASTSQHSISG